MKMSDLKNRLTCSPITSSVGGVVIVSATIAFVFGKIDGIVFAELSALGLVLLGLKDPSWLK